MRRGLFLIILFLLSVVVVPAQDSLTVELFLSLVKEFHPQAVTADLQVEKGKQVLRSARGNFDPIITSKYKEKFFQDKNYYNLFNADIVVPTITGIEAKAGYTNNAGQFLNPQNYTSSDGVGYLGVSVPIGKGMFTDENRAGLRMAKFQKEQYERLSQLSINDLLMEASSAYWEWYQNYYYAIYLDSAVAINSRRLDFVKQEFSVGETSENDTLKAFVQWQDRLQESLDAKREAISSFLLLNTFLWDDSLGLKQGLKPYYNDELVLTAQADSSINQHPALLYYDAKRLETIAYKRLTAEKLKPKLTLDYNLLYKGVMPDFGGLGENQLWGVSFELPLFLRSERAGFQLAKIKIQEIELQYDQKERELSNKLLNERAQFQVLETQTNTLNVSLKAYANLISAERLKFSLGESSLFELNMWEQKQIDNQLKTVKLHSKKNLTKAKINWLQASW